MKSSISEIPTILGTTMGGGYYAGRIMVGDQAYAIIVAPKEQGQRDDVKWNGTYKTVEGAKSVNDGLANTKAMAEAGSSLAKWAMSLDIDGHGDWYIPSLDELEIIYRNLKPTNEENYCYMRSGINQNAIEPTPPYTTNFPLKTVAELFQAEGSEAFEPRWYWTSTQSASDSNYAWMQGFGDGDQNFSGKDTSCRARAVRRLVI